MAQTKGKKRTAARSTTYRAGGKRSAKTGKRPPSRRARRRAERSHLPGSLALLGMGLVVIVMVLVRGQSGWQAVRSWLFGAFGVLTYLVGPLLLYLAYLVASGYMVGKFSVKVLLMAVLCDSVPVVFSTLELKGEKFFDVVALLFENGQTTRWSGGVLGGVLGAPLLALCGRPAANILMCLIFLLGLMVFFAVTPADIVEFLGVQWARLQAALAAADARRAAQEKELAAWDDEEKAAPPEQPQPAPHRPLVDVNPYLSSAPAPAPAAAPAAPAAAAQPSGPRADFDIDLGPDQGQRSLQNAIDNDPLEPVVIGPGGTFGLDPLKNLGSKKREPAPEPVPQPDSGFEQRLDDASAGTEDDLETLIQRAIGQSAAPAPSQPEGTLPIVSVYGADDGEPSVRPTGPQAERSAFDTLLTPPAQDAEPAAGALPEQETGEQTFDTLLEPAPELLGDTAPAAPVLPSAAIPTLSGSFDAARNAWNAGAPVADVLQGAVPAASAAPAAHAGTRYRPAVPAAHTAGEGRPSGQDLPPWDEEPDAPAHSAPAPAPAAASAAGPARAALADADGEEGDDAPLALTAQEPARPYIYPSLDLFNASSPEDEADAANEMKHNADVLISTLDSFGVKTRILDICRGPSVTRYELQPQAGIKVSRITSLADDISLNLATAGVRIEAPIPGKPAVGIEVPNKIRSTVNIRNVFESPNYINMRSPLTMALGKDIAGVAQVADLCRMPHLLIAGSTGSGKSVCVNSIIISFLFRSSPRDVRLLLIDPKVVELAEYNGIPHLLMPVVTEPRKAAGALGASVAEMERRYKLFADNNVREIKAFNRLAERDPTLEHLPYIAIVIDELADLMMVAGKEVEDYICRIAQKARAAGIHLIVATQRPSVDVITGLIKANIPSRVAFAVSSQVDSRTILDSAGAEKLLGNGDMLFLPVGAAKPVRVQGTYVTDEEIAAVLGFIKSTSDAQYNEEMIAEMERRAVAEKSSKKDSDDPDASSALDSMFDQAVECVIEAGGASASLLQRRCKLGYARAARILDQMEREKIIGPSEGAKPRAVLITLSQWRERQLSAGDHA